MSHTSMTHKRQNGRSPALMLLVLACIALTGSTLATDVDGYQPAQALGSGKSDWWTTYPSQNIKAGSSVDHPSWVLDALREKPMVILVHSSNCKPCLVQTANMKEVLADSGQDIAYYDVVAEGSGLQRATELLDAYGPTGGQQYVPTTIFITLVQGPDGEVAVAWHSAEDAMSKDRLNGYVKDAIYYFGQNQGEWS